MITVSNVSVQFGKRVLFNDVNLKFTSGNCYGIIGANGAGKTTLQNVPDISDVHVMGKVLKGMGATIDVLDEHTLEIDTSQVDSWEAPYELVAKMRASTAVMGPLLGRFHRAKNRHAGRLQPRCPQDRHAYSGSRGPGRRV